MIGKTISHYRILGQVGEGGMGVVYVAEDLLLGRRVAIKIPHAGNDEHHYRARFLREARAVSALVHKNIAAVYDLGETEDGQPYIVMELVAGQTLGEILMGAGLSLRRAVEVAREVAEALSEAHRRNIIHRDIKPSNVIINERGEVKVLDFGLAKQLDEELAGGSTPDAQTWLSARTRSDVVIGTPLYLSPEQARGAQVDGRSDLFALGALLYECVAGRPAFSGSNVIEIGAQVLHVNPPPPSRFNSRVPAELDRLILKALAKRPEDRFQTAEEFAAELARVRARLSDSDTVRTRRLANAENLLRSSALITLQRLRRPRFSPLAFLAFVAAMALVVWGFSYVPKLMAHKVDPPVLALYQQGVEAMRAGEFYKASGLFEQAVKADDAFALAHARLAEAWLEMDFFERAQGEMLVADELVSDPASLLREDALYFRAVRATVGRRPAEAVKAYEELAQLKPDQPQVQVDLGRAYDKNNETEKAFKAFTQATSRDPNYAAAFLNLGVLHARQNNLAGANAAFQLAEKLYADNREGQAEVHYQRGRLLSTMGHKDEARSELQQSLDLARSTKNLYQQVQAMLILSYNQGSAEGPATAYTAINLAQASGMNNLVASGYIVLGTLYTKQTKFDEAEGNLRRAVDLAATYKVRRVEAVALFNLGSLLSAERKNLDEAIRLVEQARDFYQQAGYVKDVATAAMLLARIKGQQGDYDGAAQALEDQLRLEGPSGDMQMVGSLHREYGSVLANQGRFTESLAHYHESLAISKALHDDQLLSYSLLNLANSLWRLGHYEEASNSLSQVVEMVGKSDKPNTDMMARVRLAEANMALSRGRFDEVKAKGEQALALVRDASGHNDLTVEADAAMCLAAALGGSPARARPLCDESAHMAEGTHDPWFIALAQLALAQVLLEAGDAPRARAAALRAQEFFASSRHIEGEWRALALAGEASHRAGDEAAAQDYRARARASLARLEQSLGEDAAGYLARADVQRLRRGLGDESVAAVR
ncbi:MAG TPA: tetratricopeptide repeat protein [Pyrinomonadaceae bacterium]|jgi:tetratricopeptide (TPR) repeat protein/tRNA A-37 threonylcarbamoyl transferase component Bud32|nr:tetratricopeptide repeat protein [Pyrinomonadaceae bacterium]